MKKNQATHGIAPLIKKVRILVDSARRTASTAVNTLQVRTNFEVGRLIIEHEQRGALRAMYGTQLLGELSERLTKVLGKGFSRSNLQNMRNFFLMYQERGAEICQKPSGKLLQMAHTPSGPFANAPIRQTLSGKFAPLSWSHYVILMGIQDATEQRGVKPTFDRVDTGERGINLIRPLSYFNSTIASSVAFSITGWASSVVTALSVKPPIGLKTCCT